MSSAASLPARQWLPAIVCLSPLVPAILMPGTGILISILILVVALALFKSARAATLAMVWKKPWLSILVGMVMGGLLAVGTAEVMRPLIEGWLGTNVDTSGLDAVAGNIGIAIFTTVIALASAAIEEVLFRGFVIGWGAKIFGKGAVPLLIVISSASFGMAHAYGLSGAVVTGLIGLALAVLYQLCGRRLLPCIAAHMMFNLIGSVALYYAS
ncbi:CPBP family intramembrane glutamic endopeptidase [Croceicoccus mobilis]|nr:CPBP family intramembrane glutamic endopeptidase [Croceicoccus mobilis]